MDYSLYLLIRIIMKITIKDRKGDVIHTYDNYKPTTVQDLKLALLKDCNSISKIH